MKKLIFLTMLYLAVVTGCEEVIDLDLNETSPAVVIQADLSSPEGVLTVFITRTGSYFEAETAEKTDDALVILENSKGAQAQVLSAGDGRYKLEQVKADPGDKFSLLVTIDNITYRAVTEVKPPVEIDTVTYTWYDGDEIFRPGYRFIVAVNDPAGENNYYRIRMYKNGYLFNRANDIVVFDDTDFNGQAINVRMHNQYYLEKGETAIVELMSIDRQAWQYFTTLNEAVNAGPGSPAPSNPVSSFTNGAQGYFYAWTYDRKVVVIEE